MPAPKFDFVPEHQLGKTLEDSTYRVTITKAGCLFFSANDVHIYDLDGKYIRLYADVTKQTIGWSILEDKTSLDDLNDSRLLKRNKGGVCLLGITKILNILKVDKGKVFQKLEVKKYISPLQSYPVYYITLK